MLELSRPAALLCLAAAGAAQAAAPYVPHVEPASGEARAALARFWVDAGLEVRLFAAEPMLANPVAFCIDDRGAFYVAETFRHRAGVTDNRDHEHRRGWLDDELACRTVQDRLAMYRRHLGDELAGYLTEQERVRRIVDTDGDGVADAATVFAEGFGDLADGIGAGLVADGGEVWYTCIPKLWRLADRDGDGVAERREALLDGFGVHTALLGHDLHGPCIGPDGKLYFSIGDRGCRVVTREGGVLDHADTGAVLRCNRDGSELEVFATGLRNPQELAFDDFGNLFTGDNNSDGGDLARLVYVVEGGDSGWRMSLQYLPTRGPWNEEELWRPHHEGQAAWIVPPIGNVGDGPAGLALHPGTGLLERYRDTFFLCDFRGGSAQSGVRTVAVAPRGAGFELASTGRLIWGVLATDVAFGVDGALYLSDWTEGWDKTGKGRIYAVRDAAAAEPDPRVAETARLLRDGMGGRGAAELVGLLGHADRRVRQRAQLELAERARRRLGAGAAGEAGAAAGAEPEEVELLAEAARSGAPLSRIHALWALGQLGRRQPGVLRPAVALLGDGDAEIRAQAARVLGSGGVAEAGPQLEQRLADPSARVRYFAAMALGELRRREAIGPLLAMLRDDADGDPWLRHGGVMALVRIGDAAALLAAADDGAAAVRRAVLLALRRLRRPEVARFLGDADPSLVLEAARAIHDVPIPEAAPALADLVGRGGLDEPALLRRVFAACLQHGEPRHATALAAFAARADAATEMRVEALRALQQWAEPPARDPVLGAWRPQPARPPAGAIAALRAELEALRGAPPAVQLAAVAAAAGLAATELAPALIDMVRDAGAPDATRIAALALLEAWRHPSLATVAELVLGDASPALRLEAFRVLATVDPENAMPALQAVADGGGVAEQRAALRALAAIDDEAAVRLLATWLDRLLAGAVPAEVRLDLIETAAARQSLELAERLARYQAQKPAGDPLAPYGEALAGGDRDAGRALFAEHTAAGCVRCHRLGGEGGGGEAGVGPDLDGVGSRLGRRELLESLIEPSRRIAPGFGTVAVTLADGTLLSGLLAGEDDRTLRLRPPATGEIAIPLADIRERTTPVSAMPPIGALLTLRELRDLVEYLASL